MPHHCVRCSRMIPSGSREILEGCKECGSHFFFYIREDQLVGITDEQAPVILDVESIRVTGEGKFELDIAKIFRKDRPLIYKLEEGKYIIDLASTLKGSVKDLIKKADEGKK